MFTYENDQREEPPDIPRSEEPEIIITPEDNQTIYVHPETSEDETSGTPLRPSYKLLDSLLNTVLPNPDEKK